MHGFIASCKRAFSPSTCKEQCSVCRNYIITSAWVYPLRAYARSSTIHRVSTLDNVYANHTCRREKKLTKDNRGCQHFDFDESTYNAISASDSEPKDVSGSIDSLTKALDSKFADLEKRLTDSVVKMSSTQNKILSYLLGNGILGVDSRGRVGPI